jgi:glyoxylate reductase
MGIFCYTLFMTKIYITRTIPEICHKMLTEKGYQVKTNELDRALTKEELIKELQSDNYDALVTLLNDKIDVEVLDNCKNVKVVANYAVGFNNIDLQAAKERNIFVTCCRGTSAMAVAEHVVALLFAVTDKIVEGQKFIENGLWKGWDPNLLMGTDVSNKVVGLVGTGNIGGRVGEILHKGFNCKIIYSDMVENKMLTETCGATKMELSEVLKNADIVSLHVPLMKETTHLINSENLKMMKPNSILINTARGPVVDEKALVEALQSKTIYGAGLDVFEFEPNVSKELLTLPNVVCSPHIASAKESARLEMAELVAKNIISVIETNTPVTEAK